MCGPLLYRCARARLSCDLQAVQRNSCHHLFLFVIIPRGVTLIASGPSESNQLSEWLQVVK
jgi:hypothetical protein